MSRSTTGAPSLHFSAFDAPAVLVARALLILRALLAFAVAASPVDVALALPYARLAEHRAWLALAAWSEALAFEGQGYTSPEACDLDALRDELALTSAALRALERDHSRPRERRVVVEAVGVEVRS